MSPTLIEFHPKAYARIAGLLYLIIAVFGAFAIGYVPSVVFIDGDATATGQALVDNQGLFRFGAFADAVVLLAEIILTTMLYVMFRAVSVTLSAMAAFARMSMIMVMAINILINILPLILLNAGTFEPTNLNILTAVLFKAHQYGVYVWGILFGMHLVFLGYLVAKSGFFPRVLGWMMFIGSAGYLLEGISKITATQNDILSWVIVGLLTLVTIGELSFAFWLLIKGMDVERWRDMAGRQMVS